MNSPFNTCCDGDEGVNLSTGSSKCVYECIVFSDFFIACIIWEYVVAIGEFDELYGM